MQDTNALREQVEALRSEIADPDRTAYAKLRAAAKSPFIENIEKETTALHARLLKLMTERGLVRPLLEGWTDWREVRALVERDAREHPDHWPGKTAAEAISNL